LPTTYSHVDSRITSNDDSKKQMRKMEKRISSFLKDKF